MSGFFTELFTASCQTSGKFQKSQGVTILDIAGYGGCVALIIYVASRWGVIFFDPYLQSDDARAVIFPYWKFHENLFDGDYIAEVMSAFTPWLHKTLYYLLTHFFDLLTVTKIVQILSITWCSFHIFMIGHRRAGGVGGLFSLYLILHTYVMLERSGGGLPRAFALPLICMTVDGIDRNSAKQSGLGAILGFALYPPAGLIALTVHGCWVVTQLFKKMRDSVAVRKMAVMFGAAILLCFISVTPSLMPNNDLGKIYSLEQANRMPEFGMKGRLAVIPLPKVSDEIMNNFKKMTQPSNDGPLPVLERYTRESGGVPFYIITGIIILAVIVGWARPPFAALYVAISGVILFGIANMVAFRLYSPERMILYSLPVAVLYLLISTLTGMGYKVSGGIVQRIVSGISLMFFIVFFGIAFKGPVGLNVDTRNEKKLFQIVQTLPNNALFAGNPTMINNVPLWGKRRVLVNYETSTPWLDKAWESIKERIYDSFSTYYASSPEPLTVLQEKYGVDYMIVHELDISPQYAMNCYYFEPFTTWVKRLCQKPSKDLIWHKAEPRSIVGRASGFIVIDLKTFLEQLHMSDNVGLSKLSDYSVVKDSSRHCSCMPPLWSM
jgi:hypothetical protein